jgi:hypothetical protein
MASQSSDITMDLTDFQSPQGLYKNDKENQADYEFTTTSYFIIKGLYNPILSNINYNKERLVICYCTQ